MHNLHRKNKESFDGGKGKRSLAGQRHAFDGGARVARSPRPDSFQEAPLHHGESFDNSFFSRPLIRQLITVSANQLPIQTLNPGQTQQLADLVEKLQHNQYDCLVLNDLLNKITLEEELLVEQPTGELNLFAILSSQPESVINQITHCIISVLKLHTSGLQEEVEGNFALFLTAFKLISWVLKTQGPHFLETNQQRSLYSLVVEGLGQSNMSGESMPTGSLFQLKYEVQRECTQIKTSILASTSLS